ncbi:MAG: hypothetical protein DI543_19140 [Bradyrhizobium icense]|nr:MAG: hypothetical protein DI543_19140 [Bradyrhizobium icense]
MNAPRRLAALRASAATKNKPDWRAARDWTLRNGADAFGDLSQGVNTENVGSPFEKKRAIWYTHTGPKFRGERFADEVEGGPDHKGWYADDDCSDKVRGIVGRLPHGRFIAGYHNSGNDEREYSERWRKARDLHDECEEAIERLRAYLVARNDQRTAARELAECEIASIRSIREELANDYADIEF